MAGAQDLSSYQKAALVDGKDTLRYRILYPENYEAGKKYPLLIFLHGSGERGRDNEKQLVHGASLFLKPEVRKNFTAIVIFPQCPPDTTWSSYTIAADPETNKRSIIISPHNKPSYTVKLVKQLSNKFIRNGISDQDRIYIAGLSMGAIGTYDLLIRYPRYYAAAFTICGASDVELMVKKVKHVPLWIFHGAKDDLVLPAHSRELYARLKPVNDEVKYTEYPDANHNSWDPAFAEPELLPWLFSHQR